MFVLSINPIYERLAECCNGFLEASLRSAPPLALVTVMSPPLSPGLIGFLPSWWLYFDSIQQILQTILFNSTRISAIEELLTLDFKNFPVLN